MRDDAWEYCSMRHRLFRIVIGVIFISLYTAFPCPASESIRVAIADNKRSVALKASSGFAIYGEFGVKHAASLTVHAAELGGRSVLVKPAKGFISVNGRFYRGAVELRKKQNGLLLVVNELDIEDYLMGVIAAEIPSDWEIEALKAQAVASRTYALYQKRRAGKRLYHILATVDSQVYLGRRGERPRAVQAVQDTRGLVVSYRGEVIPAFYHSSCGGRTEDASVLWGIDEPYLKSVDCDCQEISKYGLWEKRFTISEVIRLLRREGYRIRSAYDVASGEITPGGRVRNVLFRGYGGTTSVPAEALRAALGYDKVLSIFFEPELAGGEIVFSGRGRGHGVGLCQWGAQEMAIRGRDFRAILAHYYPGTDIVRM